MGVVPVPVGLIPVLPTKVLEPFCSAAKYDLLVSLSMFPAVGSPDIKLPASPATTLAPPDIAAELVDLPVRLDPAAVGWESGPVVVFRNCVTNTPNGLTVLSLF